MISNKVIMGGCGTERLRKKVIEKQRNIESIRRTGREASWQGENKGKKAQTE